ncbi:MAG: Smr/MutS family protein, partial [Candidatus Limnocylindrales bacterium]
VEFDLETLSPTYRLTIGLPGTSHAFAIAERLGLAPELVAGARARLSGAQQQFESTLASIKDAETTAAQALERAADAEARARREREAAAAERTRARSERQEAVAAARHEAGTALAAVHEEIAATRRMLARETLTESRLDETLRLLEERVTALPAGMDVEPAALVEPADWRPGMVARTPAGLTGRIVALDRDGRRATLAAGPLRVTADVADLVAVGDVAATAVGAAAGAAASISSAAPQSGRRGEFGGDPPSPSGSGSSRSAPAERSSRLVPSSLDLRGARVDEAMELLDSYVDRAATAGAGRVTVIHGHGTGALRDAVRESLASHPLVREWRPGERGEGGDGATIVSF